MILIESAKDSSMERSPWAGRNGFVSTWAHAGTGGEAEGTMTLITRKWRTACRDIEGADRQRKGKMDER